MEKEIPRFRIAGSVFASGHNLYQVDEEIDYCAPPNWDEVNHGKHFSAFGPGINWVPLNQAAEKLMADYKVQLKKESAPPSNEIDDLKKLVAKQGEMLLTLTAQLGEQLRFANSKQIK